MAEVKQATESQSYERDTIFEIRDLNVFFEMDRGRSHVVNSVDLDIYRGETLGIVGESGSGKSMLGRALLDAVQSPGVATGSVTYHSSEGDDISVLDITGDEFQQFRWEEISLVHQEAMSAMNPTMTVAEHFEETLVAHDHEIDEGMDHAENLLRELKLDPDHVLSSYPHELSGGMQQRVLIALALLLKPEFVVLDEPTSNLDILMQRVILRLLNRLKEKYDLTLIFISHDISMVATFADRLGVMYAFDIVELGAPETIVYDSHHPYTRALVNAVPTLTTPVAEQQPVEGEKPDSVDLPAGCKYQPRCPMADERCKTEDPELLAVGENQEAACFYADRVDNEIPLAVEGMSEDE